MAIGIGGSTPERELAGLADMTASAEKIGRDEYCDRIQRAQRAMVRQGVDAVFLYAGANLEYFTGVSWRPSERTVGAVLMPDGPPRYVAPWFELETFREFAVVDGDVHTWHEHESPFTLVDGLLRDGAGARRVVGIDEAAPFFVFDGLREAGGDHRYVSAAAITAPCRRLKSPAEIALLQCAKSLTLEVHKAAARCLRPGMSTVEVAEFIDRAHRAAGATGGSAFCIVLFGSATAFPHGVKRAQILQPQDWVLIDTGCRVHGYHSDITRTYPFGSPSARQRDAWMVEQEAQQAAFDAAVPGARCEDADTAARRVLERHGFGPDYRLPGLPHRTGHGCGLEIHESPYLVRGDRTVLEAGMVFSNEPMLVLPGEFGVRLEDHVLVTEDGPRWFTAPSPSIDDPFGYEAAG